jgi:hypothetical protein
VDSQPRVRKSEAFLLAAQPVNVLSLAWVAPLTAAATLEETRKSTGKGEPHKKAERSLENVVVAE